MKSIKPILSICFGFLCLCILDGCNNSKVTIPEKNFTTTPVKKWTCIGPFRFDTITFNPTKTYYTKDLEIPLTTEGLTAKSEGVGYIRYVRLIPN